MTSRVVASQARRERSSISARRVGLQLCGSIYLASMLWTLIVGMGFFAAHASVPDKADLPFTSVERYELPFETRVQWLDFIRSGPGGEKAAEEYATAFPDDLYRRAATSTDAEIYRIQYRSDDLSIRGFMVAPRDAGPHPVIIFNHGGTMQWGRIVLADLLEFVRLAERGYIVFASAYRGEGGSDGEPSLDGGATRDVLSLIELIDHVPAADADRIGVWGASRGGSLTYDLLSRTDRIDAAIIQAGPTDLVHAPRRAEFDEHVYPYTIADYESDKDGILAALSPIEWPERLSPRTQILLLHGTADERVQPEDTIRMALALQGLGRPYRLKVYDGGSHSLMENWNDVRAEMDSWFDRHLRTSEK